MAVTSSEISGDESAASELPPRWRRGISTLVGLPTMPVRKMLTIFDVPDLASLEREKQHGLTLVLSGIEGRGPFCASLALGLSDSWPGSVEVFEWTTRRVFGAFHHLFNEQRNREQAERVADRIERHWQEAPDAPVYLASHSGGTAIAAFALEALVRRGCRRRVNRSLLLASALSDRYDLSEALQSCDEIHSFHSPLDIPHLVLGTCIFGAMDRCHRVSAGFRGFRISHERLIQHPYQRSMVSAWHWGGHMGWTNRVFAAEHLAGLLALD